MEKVSAERVNEWAERMITACQLIFRSDCRWRGLQCMIE